MRRESVQYVFAWDTNNTAYGTDDSGGMYEGFPTYKFPQALALLFEKIFSSIWVHMKALGILFKWGYGSLISEKK